jgi:hypothetical protein
MRSRRVSTNSRLDEAVRGGVAAFVRLLDVAVAFTEQNATCVGGRRFQRAQSSHSLFDRVLFG